ncbi:uncharacterized protein BCR38DRAFT_412774 [Pseudomassariella vexata]|uniref:Uncharacterized protein n=1 Tax=Pseudomassariella vexata TaxID=1141098 RepID=A0A1Y2DIJ0_9PEZI|nr:uncharacterized protein BCR38DRAFT_412774 [Pseudomassariella vexata]ORY59051.1 hypothetical protein BCR38DRAFT_412774 [Pseudomassariella vexata]
MHNRCQQSQPILQSLIRPNLAPVRVKVMSHAMSKAESPLYDSATVLDPLTAKLCLFTTNYITVDTINECGFHEQNKLSAAKRPLLLGELQEVLSTSADENAATQKRRYPISAGTLSRLKNCPTLCTARARFPMQIQGVRGQMEMADNSVGGLCVIYLDGNDFETANRYLACEIMLLHQHDANVNAVDDQVRPASHEAIT